MPTRFFYARWPPRLPSHFSDNASLTWPLSSSSKSNPPLPSERVSNYQRRSGESTSLPPMSPGFKFRRGRHMWLSYRWVSSLSRQVFPQVLRYSLPLKIQKKKKFAKKGTRRTTTCCSRLPLNHYLFVIVCYLSYITKPSKKFSDLIIMLMTS